MAKKKLKTEGKTLVELELDRKTLAELELDREIRAMQTETENEETKRGWTRPALTDPADIRVLNENLNLQEINLDAIQGMPFGGNITAATDPVEVGKIYLNKIPRDFENGIQFVILKGTTWKNKTAKPFSLKYKEDTISKNSGFNLPKSDSYTTNNTGILATSKAINDMRLSNVSRFRTFTKTTDDVLPIVVDAGWIDGIVVLSRLNHLGTQTTIAIDFASENYFPYASAFTYVRNRLVITRNSIQVDQKISQYKELKIITARLRYY